MEPALLVQLLLVEVAVVHLLVRQSVPAVVAECFRAEWLLSLLR